MIPCLDCKHLHELLSIPISQIRYERTAIQCTQQSTAFGHITCPEEKDEGETRAKRSVISLPLFYYIYFWIGRNGTLPK